MAKISVGSKILAAPQDASQVPYDNGISELTANQVQAAIDELAILESGGLREIPQATESILGGVKAKVRTSETHEITIDSSTGKLYAPISDATYIHDQLASSKNWTINHPLNKYPSITIIDSGNTLVSGEIEYVSKSILILHFSSEFSGKAYLN